MRETQKRERLRFAQSRLRSSLSRKATKFDQASLLWVQFQAELPKSLFKLLQASLSLQPMLEADDEIVRVAHHDNVTPRMVLAPRSEEHTSELQSRPHLV